MGKRKRSIPLYHWSPRDRRASILRTGLEPGKWSKDREWKPSYICFSASPSLAWALSGKTSEIYGEWDLWMMWSDRPSRYRTLNSCNKPRCCTEYRVYERIPKRNIWYVGSRVHQPRKKR